MDKKVANHLKELNQIDSQRKKWLFVSVFVVIAVLAVILDWNYIEQHRILWLVLSLSFTVGVVWWYWTMSIIRQLIGHRIDESSILREIIVDIRSVKTEIKKVLSDIKKPK
jgi:hypothetical protein